MVEVHRLPHLRIGMWGTQPSARKDGAPILHGRGTEVGYPPALFRAPDMISLLSYCLVRHASYLSVVRIGIAMLSLGAWSGLASISGVALMTRISRITLVTRPPRVACVPLATSLACIPRLSLLSGLPLRARLSGRSRPSLRCRCCRCCRRCLLGRCLATNA